MKNSVVAKTGNKPASVGTSQAEEPPQLKFGNNSFGRERCESNVLVTFWGILKALKHRKSGGDCLFLALWLPVSHVFWTDD